MVRLTKINIADSDILREARLNELNESVEESIENDEIFGDSTFEDSVKEVVKNSKTFSNKELHNDSLDTYSNKDY